MYRNHYAARHNRLLLLIVLLLLVHVTGHLIRLHRSHNHPAGTSSRPAQIEDKHKFSSSQSPDAGRFGKDVAGSGVEPDLGSRR